MPANIKASKPGGIYILLDFRPCLADPVRMRPLQDIALAYDTTQQTIVLIAHEIRSPPELKNFSALVRLALTDEEALFNEFHAEIAARNLRETLRAADNMVSCALEYNRCYR